MWEILLSNADWDCFRTLTLREILKIQNPLRGWTLCIFGSHTFVPISWMWKKQTSVSHSSTESEIISLDTGLRLEGLLVLELCDLIVSVFGNISHISDRTGQPVNGKNKSYNKIDAMQDIDSVPSNVQSASREALLYVFEDIEAAIKMIIKRRTSTMRHVSRTHRVALDWLFDRINLDSKIQMQIHWNQEPTCRHLDQRGISHVMSGIICWACLTLAISVLQFALLQWRSEFNKNQEKNESQQNQNLWWVLLRGRHRSCCLQLQWARWKYYGNQDPWKSVVVDDRSGQPDRLSPAGYSKSDCDRSWSSQEWKVRLRHTIDQGNLIKLLGMRCNKFVFIMETLFSTEVRNP